MAVNKDQKAQWPKDIEASVKQYNEWFLLSAPATYAHARQETAEFVARTLEKSDYLRDICPKLFRENPEVLFVLRMCTAPPIARDRLIGLSGVSKSLVNTLEKDHRIPPQMKADVLDRHLQKIGTTIQKMADPELFPWLKEKRPPTEKEIERAAITVGDRYCGAVADPIIRNDQEARQLDIIRKLLVKNGYTELKADERCVASKIPTKTFAFHLNVPVKNEDGATINMTIDTVIMPPGKATIPLLVEAKSAGDFTNVNKRRKEEATKVRQLTSTYKKSVRFILFLCGYFDQNYLAYEAAAGIDWVWEHRPEDLLKFGL